MQFFPWELTDRVEALLERGADLIEVTVAQLGLDRTTNSPVVILREKDGARVLPIWIGPAEASAIAMELQGIKPPRPMTHDLLKTVITGLGAERAPDRHQRPQRQDLLRGAVAGAGRPPLPAGRAALGQHRPGPAG